MKKISAAKTSSKGIVMGNVYKVVKQELTPDTYAVTDVEEEVKKYKDAVVYVTGKIEELASKNEIFAAHMELVQDVALVDGVTSKINNEHMNAQQALEATIAEFVMVFEMMDDEYMRERAADVKDVGNRLMTRLKGLAESNFDDITEKVILVAEDLAPSDTAKLNMEYILGFITELGGVTSHVCIMARSLGLPALVGMEDLMNSTQNGNFVIMDAGKGDVFINPDQATIDKYAVLAEEFQEKQRKLEEAAHLPAVSKDGHKVKVCANVGNVEDVKNAAKHYIDGVGLFRSEFLYMENTHFPTEEEQFQVYKEAAENCPGELIIRTLDIGGDKELPYYEFEKEENPFLGWRAIRISLDLEDVFKQQLRALLRASAYGDIWIMYPMVISLEEITRANELLDICKQELDKEGIAYNKEIKVGMMIETPASVMNVKCFAKQVDFFSIGTNDLTQYLLAVDRGNKKISKMYNSFHPAVLHAIGNVIEAGHEANIQVGMCGEFASDERAAKVLLGMGLDEFSVSAGEVANIKSMIRDADYEECKKMADKVMDAFTIDEIMTILGEK